MDTQRWWRVAALGALAWGAQACGAFAGRRVVNMAPFAENTLSLVGDLRLGTPQPVFLRSFALAQPDVLAARETGARLRTLLRGIVFYSLQVAAINAAAIPEEQKPQELARYLEEALRSGIRAQQVTRGMNEAQLDSVLGDVRAQETYLGALRAADPIVDQAVQTADEVISAFDAQVRAASLAIGAQVESDYAPHRANDEGLRALEARAMQDYIRVSRMRLGDTTTTMSAEELARRERELTERLAQIHVLREQVRPETELYVNRLREMDEIVVGALTTARQARASIILWSRAHRNMAAGIALPPEIDVVSVLRDATTKLPGM